jgi:hypothetical protein
MTQIARKYPGPITAPIPTSFTQPDVDDDFDFTDDRSLGQIMQMWQNARTVDDSEDALRMLERWQDRRYGHILPKW